MIFHKQYTKSQACQARSEGWVPAPDFTRSYIHGAPLVWVLLHVRCCLCPWFPQLPVRTGGQAQLFLLHTRKYLRNQSLSRLPRRKELVPESLWLLDPSGLHFNPCPVWFWNLGLLGSFQYFSLRALEGKALETFLVRNSELRTLFCIEFSLIIYNCKKAIYLKQIFCFRRVYNSLSFIVSSAEKSKQLLEKGDFFFFPVHRSENAHRWTSFSMTPGHSMSETLLSPSFSEPMFLFWPQGHAQ